MHTGALCAVCRLAAPPPLPLEINIALCSCSSRSCVAPMDRSTPARRLGCTVLWLASENISRLIAIMIRCITDMSNNFTRKMNQRSANAALIRRCKFQVIPNYFLKSCIWEISDFNSLRDISWNQDIKFRLIVSRDNWRSVSISLSKLLTHYLSESYITSASNWSEDAARRRK